MTFKISVTVRTSMLQALVDALDAKAAPGALRLYTGSQPSTEGEATTDDLQATITLAKPCATVSAGVATFVADVEGQRIDSQSIGWGRFVDGDGEFVADASVLPTGAPGAADIRIGNASGYTGSFVRLASGVIGL
jgi:hypothetical protein